MFEIQILGQKARGEIGFLAPDHATCGDLLNDLLDHAKANIKASTARIWELVIEANIRPFFRLLEGQRSHDGSPKRLPSKASLRAVVRKLHATASFRSCAPLSHLGRKCTPPKVTNVPFFPMVAESAGRQGFLADEQYRHLRDALPDYLKPLFVCGYFTGVRVGELLALRWDQVDWEQRFITLNADETKAVSHGRFRSWTATCCTGCAGLKAMPMGVLGSSIERDLALKTSVGLGPVLVLSGCARS